MKVFFEKKNKPFFSLAVFQPPFLRLPLLTGWKSLFCFGLFFTRFDSILSFPQVKSRIPHGCDRRSNETEKGAAT